ncbi:spiroplasma plectrovirus-related protein [Spiroplasma phoeniceum P40]|uniref:Spiroplasma plectrovirus-related protein n=1 Tax=Spiroplasma phoeniceum P40 TaxID=1276259 RepID=A0A345DQ15_9MOLU|nr:spiroplasma plectrovirus-related protein [Spiroplasma phoeniceum P40]
MKLILLIQCFLRSSFFENWSETNYFINPTLKTSKNLLFNDKWYLDFLQDSYSTGVVYDEPDEIFLNYYRQWHSLKSRYMVEKFYDVKRENFLNDLTDFIYAFAVKYKMFHVSKKKLSTMLTAIKKIIIQELNNKWYFYVRQFGSEYIYIYIYIYIYMKNFILMIIL